MTVTIREVPSREEGVCRVDHRRKLDGRGVTHRLGVDGHAIRGRLARTLTSVHGVLF